MPIPRELSLVQRVALIKQLCAGRRVLHLGCTNFPYTEQAIENDMLLHFDLEEAAKELWGIDADPDGIKILNEHGTDQVIPGDLEKLEDCSVEGTFDVIIAGEIIEHLNNPGLFLTGVQRYMRDDTLLILTTVNAYCGMRFFYYGLRGRGGVAEPVHPDHVAYYSYSTLRLLINRHGLDVDRFLFYDVGIEHYPHMRWHQKLVNRVAVRFASQLSDGIIAICKLRKA